MHSFQRTLTFYIMSYNATLYTKYTAMYSHGITVKSVKTENWQKMLKSMILEIPYGDLL